MFERLEAIKVRYEQLTEELSKPEVLGDYNQLKKLSKEQKDLLKDFDSATGEKNYKDKKSFMDKLKDFFTE